MQDYEMINDATEGDFNLDINLKTPDYSFVESHAMDVGRFPVTGHLQSYFDKDLWAIKLSEGASITVSVLSDLFLPLIGSPLNRELIGETILGVSFFELVHNTGSSDYSLIVVDDTNGDGALKIDSIASSLAVQNGWGLSAGEPFFYDSVLTGSDEPGLWLHTGLFLIEVSGLPIDLSHTTQKDAGRYLITVGNPTGQRAAMWGSDWINMVESVPDTIAPSVLSFSPVDGATGVAPGSNIVLTFSESITRGTGSLLLKTAAGATVETYDAATSNRLTLSGSTLTIDPTSDLANGTNYYVTLAAGTIQDLAGNAYAGITTYDFTTASSTSPLSKQDDFVVLQYASPSVVGAGVGNDTYLLSNAMLPAETKITLTDPQGSNSIQLASGLAIASSKLNSNTLQLTLSNGSEINVLGADRFTYETGGNATAGINLPDVDYATFVQNILGVALPTGSTIASGGAVTIGSSLTNVPLVVGSTAPVTASAASEAFTFHVAGAKASAPDTQIQINGFSVANDQLTIDTVTAAGNIKLAALDGTDGITVQSNPITGDTLIDFGADANGDVITITLTGITDPSLVNVSVI